MTVHVHKSVAEIAIGDTKIRRDAKKRGITKDTERTWAFDGPADFEERVLRDVSHTASHPGGVPLTHEEELLKADLESKAMTETARLSQALAGLVKERLTEVA